MRHSLAKLGYHEYELRAVSLLGAVAKSAVRQGALLRVEHEGGPGYADLHPWVELGDVDLPEQLRLLSGGSTTELSRASLAFAAIDSAARAQKRSLWEGITIPSSHFLVPNVNEDGARVVENALAEGFTRVKVKIGRDLIRETLFLREACAALEKASQNGDAGAFFRLDCNETLTRLGFGEAFTGLADARRWMDFVEDPCPFDIAQWESLSAGLGVFFAVDRAGLDPESANWSGARIVKPARSGPQSGDLGTARGRQIVTSYLDHPLGQACAAWVAGRCEATSPGEIHGLVSHRVYEKNEFSEQLGWHGPSFMVPEGSGFGFDESLSKLDWVALT